MASNPFTPKYREYVQGHSAEEREGLLHSDQDNDNNKVESEGRIYIDNDKDESSDGWSRSKIIKVASALIAILVFGAFTRALLRSPPPRTYSNLGFHGDLVRSNGTHDFKRTVLIVSIDGLRADYLDRGLTPHLLDISKEGLRAKSMMPVFPTLTFPNHWALMTGLHAESHGIIANVIICPFHYVLNPAEQPFLQNFWDPKTKQEFHYNKIDSAWKSEFWLGEPMWETAGKAGIITANLMWPGPPKTTSGASSTYFVPWQDKVALSIKLDKIFEWIDMPLEERPQLIMAYEPSLDQAGHATGPMSARVNRTLGEVDLFAKQLHLGLVERNLTDIVDIIFVSDHGMADTAHPTLIYIDDEDMLGMDGLAALEHEDGWPAMGLRFNSLANETYYLNKLLRAKESSRKDAEGFDVYTKETMPERWHFAHHERIAPVWIVPKLHYALTTREQGDVGMTKGNHGYDNTEPSMHAMFVAHGPFSSVVKTLQASRKGIVSGLLPWKTKGWHSTSDDTYIIDTFRNVEIYGLVMKLLGVEEGQMARTNGTVGFWDKYF
ncbi:hypothetical protein D9758_015180 [Tetrapyrgos nigripes]|uniref:Phosphodiest-domain-containing protein n=1 Tax=Tetrapyrgos nigripes TaxID=182062 RepID=A0A8H5C1N6_9AGAR|nr:hypothetical protein D9758_015180 [Tetrapyrgos nigripes]